MIVRELFARFGIDFEGSAIVAAHQGVNQLLDDLGDLSNAVTGAALVVGLGSLVHDMVELGEETLNTSSQLGLSATELTEWRYIATQAGLSTEQLTGAMARLAQNVEGATSGDTRMRATFRRLGVELRDSEGNIRSMSDLMEDVGVAINNIESDTERTTTAMRIFGESGRRLIPAFAGGREELTAMREEVRRMYGTDLERLGEVSADYNAELGRWDLALNAVRTSLVLDLLPVLRVGVGVLAEWAVQFRLLTRGSRALEVTLGGLAIVGAIAGAIMIAPFLETIALAAVLVVTIGAVILVVDDLVVLFEGGDSVIGDFIDTLFGVGAAAEFVRAATDAWALSMVLLQGQLFLLRSLLTSVFGEEVANALTTVNGFMEQFRTNVRVTILEVRQLLTFLTDVSGRLSNMTEALSSGNISGAFEAVTRSVVEAPTGPVVDRASASKTTTVNATVTAPITVVSSSPEEAAEAVRGVIRDHETETLRRAADSLINTED